MLATPESVYFYMIYNENTIMKNGQTQLCFRLIKFFKVAFDFSESVKTIVILFGVR